MADNWISGNDSYVKLGTAEYEFGEWQFPIKGGVKTFFAFGSKFQRTLPGGVAAQVRVKGAYNQGNMPLVVHTVYEVHLGFMPGIEVVVNGRLNDVDFSSKIGAGGEPGGQVECVFESDGEFTLEFS